MKPSISILLIVVAIPAFSQWSRLRISLSDKHLDKIELITSPTRKLQKYRKYYRKDSSKMVKKWGKYFRTRSDSILMSTLARISSAESGLSDKLAGFLTKDNDPDKRALSLSFNPEPFKNEAEVFYAGHYTWRRELGRWYLSSGYYKPDSAGTNRAGFPFFSGSKLHLSRGIQGIPALPGLPDIDGQSNALKGKAKGHALSKLNSIPGANEAKQIKGDVGKYSGQLSQYKNQYGKYVQNPDSLKSLARQEGSTLAQREMESRMSAINGMKDFKNYQNELSKVKGLQDHYSGQVDQLKDSAYLRKKAKEKAEEMTTKYLKEHPEIMNAVQKRMSLLMKKYSMVPNSNDLSTAIKKTSLKGRTFKERIVLAANFQALSYKPVTVDFSPSAGYKVNSRFVVGLGGLYRQTFKDSALRLSPQVIGYKAFSSYDVVKSFFAYAEFARNSPGVKVQDNRSERIWNNVLIAGIGKKFLIHPKIEMTLVVGYDFFHQNMDPIYPRPFILRIGFQTGELAFLKRRPQLPSY